MIFKAFVLFGDLIRTPCPVQRSANEIIRAALIRYITSRKKGNPSNVTPPFSRRRQKAANTYDSDSPSYLFDYETITIAYLTLVIN